MKAVTLLIDYGFSGKEGWRINPRNPENFYNTAIDFTVTSESWLIIGTADFINAVKYQAVKLQGLTT